MYDFNKIVDRKQTNSLKWEFMDILEPDCSPDAIPFWVADMDFPCAEPIIEALHKRVNHRIFGYSSNRTDAYYESICNFYQRRFNWKIAAESICYSPGIVPALGYLIDLLTEPGEGVILQSPVYYPFTKMIETHQVSRIANSLIDNNGYYEMDFEDLTNKAKDPNNKLLLFSSPHNPVGRVWQKDELIKLVSICFENNVKIVSDEIHCDLLRRGVTHIPLETLFPDDKDKIITCISPSKTFNMAGMMMSSILIHDPNLKEKWNQHVHGKLGLFQPPALSIVASQSAYNDGEEWLEYLLDYLDENMNTVETFLKDNLPKAKFLIPEGTYLIWIDITSYSNDIPALVKKLAIKGGILLEAGKIFGKEGKNYVRMNVACPQALLKEGLKRLAATLGQGE